MINQHLVRDTFIRAILIGKRLRLDMKMELKGKSTNIIYYILIRTALRTRENALYEQ